MLSDTLLQKFVPISREYNLGLPLMVGRVKQIYIYVLGGALVCLLLICVGGLLLVIDAINLGEQMGIRPRLFGLILTFLVGCMLLLFWFPREYRRTLVICELGLLVFNGGQNSTPTAVLWSDVRFDYNQNLFVSGQNYFKIISLKDFDPEVVELIERKLKESSK